MAIGQAGRYLELIKEVLRSERLDELPEVPRGTDRSSFFSRLMKPEELPFDDPVAAKGAGPGDKGLFASERLPFDDNPEPGSGRASFFATLFSRESLPEDPRPGPGPAGRAPGR